jgi:hypothetical protein
VQLFSAHKNKITSLNTVETIMRPEISGNLDDSGAEDIVQFDGKNMQFSLLIYLMGYTTKSFNLIPTSSYPLQTKPVMYLKLVSPQCLNPLIKLK